jgi:hypothetical protein
MEPIKRPQSAGRQVKGSMFIIFAKAINADKEATFDSFLTDQDRRILSKLILK